MFTDPYISALFDIAAAIDAANNPPYVDSLTCDLFDILTRDAGDLFDCAFPDPADVDPDVDPEESAECIREDMLNRWIDDAVCVTPAGWRIVWQDGLPAVDRA